MSRLIKICHCSGAPRASVIFVHGLGGHAYDTWRRDEKTFWPFWLAEDVPGIAVYTIAYEAPPTNWLGTAMPLQDRAVNILEYLFSEDGLKTAPIIFVCHSLGGLILKQIMLDLDRQKDARSDASALLERVTAVAFVATPHTGSQKGNLLQRLSFLAWPTTIASILVANDPTLRSINVGYRGLAQSRRETLRHKIFYETQDTGAGRIVDEASSDPGLPGDPPIPIDADHISIAKPADRAALLYVKMRDFVGSTPALAAPAGALEQPPLPEVRSEQARNIVPKLMRVAVVGAVALVGYKGAQALIAPPPPIDPAQIGQMNEKLDRIAEKLLTLSSAQASPERKQAINEAVAATAASAKAGDRRFESALDLLKLGKTTEAAAILEQVAEEKSARIKSDRLDAAAAYRNLGAIAGLRDPKKALEAYSKAVEFNPQDREALYWKSWLSFLAGNLTVAETSFAQLLRLSESAGDPHGTYRANLRLGEVAKERGNLGKSLELARLAKGIAEAQSSARTADLEWQRNLSVSYNKVGDVQVAQGDLKAALNSYEHELAIAERLAKADPANAGWQRDLSVSYDKVGDVQVAQGDLKAALNSYTQSRDIRERLAIADPRNAGWQRDLSVSYNKVGDVQVAQGDLKAALNSYEHDLAIAERLAIADPGNAGWQRDLSVSYAKLASTYMKSGEKAQLREALNGGRAIVAPLVKDHPDWAEWKKDLVWFDAQLADLDKGASSESSPRREKKKKR